MSEKIISQSPIIINHMYSGKYLDDNIGHEIINLFKADDGENYIYLCKDGKYNGELPKYVIQVRRYGTRTLEVVNIAEVDADWEWNYTKAPKPKKDKEDWVESRKRKIETIKYGGVDLKSIFENNSEQGTDTYVTFKATKVVKPKSPVYISYWGNRAKTNDKNEENKKTPYPQILTSTPIVLEQRIEEGKNEKFLFDVSEALRNIVKYDIDEGSDYQKLNKLAEEAFHPNEWIVVDNQIEIKDESNDKEGNKIDDTPGDIYKINNLELPYSNAFKYFIDKDPTLFTEFCHYLLEREEYHKQDDKLQNLCDYLDDHKNNIKLTILREWENIDIIIQVDKKWVIVIENKIFSDLNGKTEKEITQLDKYNKIITDGKKTSKDKEDVDVKGVPEHDKACEIFILLTPDHNDINISSYNTWRKLHYSHINGFLKSLDSKNLHLSEFEKMIEQHSVKDYNYGVMKRRFKRALLKVQTEINN